MKRCPRLLTATLSSLLAFPLFFPAGGRVYAQTAASTPRASTRPRALAPAAITAPERIILLRLNDAPGGARVTVASDAPLDTPRTS